jgi:NDP-sugar pyrophosphorylase family protein
MKQDLYIIAAGKGSRMGSNIPKALIPIAGGEPCLTSTLKRIGHKFNNVFIVVNIDIIDVWSKYLYNEVDYNGYELDDIKNVVLIPIKSGLGDGHAVKVALDKAPILKTHYPLSEDIVVCWGDVFFEDGNIIDELLSRRLEGAGLIPGVRENNPYVTLFVDGDMKCLAADFSKYGENHPTGFHDQSVFRFDRHCLLNALERLDAAYWKNGRYMTPGGELSLLYTFHYLFNSDNPMYVYETDYPTKSFNTISEVESIQLEINK